MANTLAFERPRFGLRALVRGETVVVPPRTAATLKVHNGVVWATSSGDPDDVWLLPGQEHALGDKGRTVIESTAPATIELVPAAANDRSAGQPTLHWARAPAWLDDAGALVALAAIVAVMATAAAQAPW